MHRLVPVASAMTLPGDPRLPDRYPPPRKVYVESDVLSSISAGSVVLPKLVFMPWEKCSAYERLYVYSDSSQVPRRGFSRATRTRRQMGQYPTHRRPRWSVLPDTKASNRGAETAFKDRPTPIMATPRRSTHIVAWPDIVEAQPLIRVALLPLGQEVHVSARNHSHLIAAVTGRLAVEQLSNSPVCSKAPKSKAVVRCLSWRWAHTVGSMLWTARRVS